jgi:hypothetical protein
MSYAGLADVQVSLGRPLTDDEQDQADGLLDRVESRIYARISDLDTRLADEDNLVALLVEVESDAVARVLRNPSGLLQEQDGDYAYTRDRRVSSGSLSLTEDEWARLGVGGGAFTIDPTNNFAALLGEDA